MTKKDKKFTIRDVSKDDHEWLVALHNDPLVLRNLTNPDTITLEQHLCWWKTIDGKRQIRKVFCINGEKIGFCKFYNIDLTNKNCVLGGDIHIKHRGKGYAKIMWGLMLDFCYNDLNLFRVSLTTAEYNKIGYRVYEGLGFKEEGRMIQSLLRDDTYYDQICMYNMSEWWKK